jgi:hypothetical protein
MLESYISAVENYYLPALLATALALAITFAIAQFIESVDARPQLRRVTAPAVLAMSFWPLIIPLICMLICFVASIIAIDTSRRLGVLTSQSDAYRRLLQQFKQET